MTTVNFLQQKRKEKQTENTSTQERGKHPRNDIIPLLHKFIVLIIKEKKHQREEG